MKGLLFKLAKWIIRKYFNDGLNPVYNSKPDSDQIIAWKWIFYDEAYEKEKYGD